VLGDVLLARRVLDLRVDMVPGVVPQPLALSSDMSVDSLLVTSLSVFFPAEHKDRLTPCSAVPVGALIGVFPSLMHLHLSFPDSAFSSHLFSTLCSALQSARAPALVVLFLRCPNFIGGAALSWRWLFVCDSHVR
jgi:hypothetical protein